MNKDDKYVDSFFTFIIKKIKIFFSNIKNKGILKYWKESNKKSRQLTLLITISMIFIISSVVLLNITFNQYMQDIKSDIKQNIDINIKNDTDNDININKSNNDIDINISSKTKKAVITSNANINIREYPNETSNIIGSLPNGYIIEISIENDNWCKLSNSKGWISSRYIKYIN